VQKGNPILQCIKNVPLSFVKASEQAADFVVGTNACVLFLSVKFHMLHPKYIWTRIRALGKSYDLRVLVVHVDIDDNVRSLAELNKICFTSELSMVLAWSVDEAARYVETLKAYENKGSKSIQKKEEKDFIPAITRTLTDGIRAVNKTDVVTLLEGFGNLKGICDATEQQLMLCPGFGDTKVRSLHAALHTSFKTGTARRAVAATTTVGAEAAAAAAAASAAAAGAGALDVQHLP
jgi:DNA excision repair protein ERCC-1